MRKKYTKIEMEIIEFDVEDVITTSGEGNNDNTGEGNNDNTGEGGGGDEVDL